MQKISKNSKVPYTDQLVRNIGWSIFIGEVRWAERLPPIRVLADELRVNINTVHNTYKRLGQQELAIIRPHIGTIVQTESIDRKKLEGELVTSIKNTIYYQLSIGEVRSIMDKVLKKIEESKKKSVTFVYEEKNIGHRFTIQTTREVDVQVEEVHLDQLRGYLEEHRGQIKHLGVVITTCFQYTRVRSIARSYQPIVYDMTVEVTPDVTEALQSLESDSVAAAICEKEESADGSVNLVHRMCPELGAEVCYGDRRSGWKKTAQKASVICMGPQLAGKARQRDWEISVYEIWDRTNEQSMNMLKDYLH